MLSAIVWLSTHSISILPKRKSSLRLSSVALDFLRLETVLKDDEVPAEEDPEAVLFRAEADSEVGAGVGGISGMLSRATELLDGGWAMALSLCEFLRGRSDDFVRAGEVFVGDLASGLPGEVGATGCEGSWSKMRVGVYLSVLTGLPGLSGFGLYSSNFRW